jgi:hypothetical protein
VLSALAPVLDAIDKAEARNQSPPAPRTVSETLIRMGAIDQSGRLMISKVNWSALSPEEGREADALLAQRLEPIDRANLAELLKLLPPAGWFSFSQFGRPAAEAAFHVVQHGDTATQQRVLPSIEALAKVGEADPESFAKMYDRVAVALGRPQRYGTQFHCIDGFTTPFPLEDPADVEARRRAIGLTGSFAGMAAAVASQACR